MGEGCKNHGRQKCRIIVFGIAYMNFGIGDMNRCRLCAPLAPVKVGSGKGRPVKIIKDNSVETIIFGNTEISHPCNHTVPQGNVAG